MTVSIKAKKPAGKKAAPKKKFAGKETPTKAMAEAVAAKAVPQAVAVAAQADAEIAVAVEDKYGGVMEQEVNVEKVALPVDVVAPNGHDTDVEINFGLQAIIPTGDFQNIRVSVGITAKCEGDMTVMDNTFDVLKEWTDNKISGVVTEILEGE